MTWKLRKANGAELNIGDTLVTFRGDTVTLTGMRPPHKPSSSGHVALTWADGSELEVYPGVVDAWFELKGDDE